MEFVCTRVQEWIELRPISPFSAFFCFFLLFMRFCAFADRYLPHPTKKQYRLLNGIRLHSIARFVLLSTQQVVGEMLRVGPTPLDPQKQSLAKAEKGRKSTKRHEKAPFLTGRTRRRS